MSHSWLGPCSQLYQSGWHQARWHMACAELCPGPLMALPAMGTASSQHCWNGAWIPPVCPQLGSCRTSLGGTEQEEQVPALHLHKEGKGKAPGVTKGVILGRMWPEQCPAQTCTLCSFLGAPMCGGALLLQTSTMQFFPA